MSRLSPEQLDRHLNATPRDSYERGLPSSDRQAIRTAFRDAYIAADESDQLRAIVLEKARQSVHLEAHIAELQTQLATTGRELYDAQQSGLLLCAKCLEETSGAPAPAVTVRGGRAWCGVHFPRPDITEPEKP